MTGDAIMEHDEATRRAAIALLSRGDITAPEAAKLAGVSRQLMAHWIKRAGVDWRRIRDARLLKAWRKARARGQ
jgi:predicted HTH domain antitoxin